MKRKTRMTCRHYQERRKWARDHVQCAGRWKRVIVLYEKIQHGLTGRLRQLMVRPAEEGEVFFEPTERWWWIHDMRCHVLTAGFPIYTLWMVLWTRNATATPYRCRSWRVCSHWEDFQQDCAKVYTSHETRMWFSGNIVYVLPRPAKSPNVNTIENLWGLLARVSESTTRMRSLRSDCPLLDRNRPFFHTKSLRINPKALQKCGRASKVRNRFVNLRIYGAEIVVFVLVL